jgi:sugar O-acyltransferase (sialic acid O-acetyltransferase NeuD family)
VTDPTSRVVILGAGGHARVVLALLRATGATVAGCVAPDRPDSRWPREIAWLGNDDSLRSLGTKDVLLANGIGSIDDCGPRRKAFEVARSAGFHFLTVCHPRATVEADVSLGEGAQVMAGAILQTGVRIGANAIINTGAIVDHDSLIGDHAHVAPGSRLSGGVTIGSAAHIGTGTIVIQGITIGNGAVVGAGAVVLADVADDSRVAGVPAAPLRSRQGIKP